MTRYIREITQYGLLKNKTAKECVSAPIIVPKRPQEMYPLTGDYQQVNS